jgi:hypothetical protein
MRPHGDRKKIILCKPNGPWDANDKFNLVRAGALCTGGFRWFPNCPDPPDNVACVWLGCRVLQVDW